MEGVARAEVDRWPRGERVALHPRLQALTLEVILRAVFGLGEGERLDALRERLTAILEFGSNPISLLPPLQRLLGGHGPWGRFDELSEETDAILEELIDERRSAGVPGDDVLTMLLEARHEDGSEMSQEEIRDELMTLLVAGHETTASELAWCFARLSHEPRVLERLVGEIDGGDGEAYLTATVQETLRRRPVLPNAAPRYVKAPIEVGGWSYPAGVCLVANTYLVQHDPKIYPDPYCFCPERFLDTSPGTYTWIPFGGGRRRCIGANFALLEMRIVLRTVLEANELIAAGEATEVARRRAITISPAQGAEAVLEGRPVAA
jgi:cytochrome P450